MAEIRTLLGFNFAMTNSQRLAAVRRCLDRWLETQLGGEEIEIRDAVLIRSGFYVGRRFQCGAYQAVWFIEEDELKVHDSSGSLVARFDSAAIDQVNQIASESVYISDNDNEIISTLPMQGLKPARESGVTSENTGHQVSGDTVRTDREVRRAA